MNSNKEEFSYQYSLNRNTISIFEPITSQCAERVIAQIFYLNDKFNNDAVPKNERIITVQINSPGGSVSDGLAIYDAMHCIDAKISTVGLGMCASMAAFLLASGSKGMRRATENCEILIHQPLGGAQGQASDIIIAARHIEKVKEKLGMMLANMTGQSLEKIREDTDRDTVFNAFEAMNYGLVDQVIKIKNDFNGGKEDAELL